MDEMKIRSAVQQSLGNACFPDARKQAVLETIRGEKPMKKKLSLALVCALMLALALGGAALAAALGVFGRLSASPYDAQKLARLDEASETLDKIRIFSIFAPEMKKVYIETYGCQMNVADSEIGKRHRPEYFLP